MRSLLLLGSLLIAAGSPAAQENRLWFADLELVGPLDAVVLDCGLAGRTRLDLGMLAGEQRTLGVPVPARVPLGLESLASHPLPELRAEGGGAAMLSGWSPEQPAARADALVALRRRPRPPVMAHEGTPPLAPLALALAASVLAFGLRRRPGRSLAVGGVGALLVLGTILGLSPGPGAGGVALLELENGLLLGLQVEGARGEIELPATQLEVRPEGRALELDLCVEGADVVGWVRSPGAELFGLEVQPAPELQARRNGFEDLSAVWVRNPSGTWTPRGAWKRGEAIPAGGGEAGDGGPDVPPGWISTGLPPGRGVLIGRFPGGGSPAWIRVAGFQERD